jgi:hypothetical protein
MRITTLCCFFRLCTKHIHSAKTTSSHTATSSSSSSSSGTAKSYIVCCLNRYMEVQCIRACTCTINLHTLYYSAHSDSQSSLLTIPCNLLVVPLYSIYCIMKYRTRTAILHYNGSSTTTHYYILLLKCSTLAVSVKIVTLLRQNFLQTQDLLASR